ncbi:hypothetical protein AMTRI_Chr04g251520 [Amborella trichopoda]
MVASMKSNRDVSHRSTPEKSISEPRTIVHRAYLTVMEEEVGSSRFKKGKEAVVLEQHRGHDMEKASIPFPTCPFPRDVSLQIMPLYTNTFSLTGDHGESFFMLLISGLNLSILIKTLTAAKNYLSPWLPKKLPSLTHKTKM